MFSIKVVALEIVKQVRMMFKALNEILLLLSCKAETYDSLKKMITL